MHHSSTGLPSWLMRPACIAASSSLVGSEKFCVLARNSIIGTPSAVNRCAIWVAAHGSKPTLTTRNRPHRSSRSVSIWPKSVSLPDVIVR